MINDLLNAINEMSYEEIIFIGLCIFLISIFVFLLIWVMPQHPIYEWFPVGRI